MKQFLSQDQLIEPGISINNKRRFRVRHFVFLMLILILLASLWFGYKRFIRPSVHAYVSKIAGLLPSKTEPIEAKKPNLSQVAEAEPIRFEFYDTLPSQQLHPDPISETPNHPATFPKFANATPSLNSKKTTHVISALALEKEFADHLLTKYILQLGLFRNEKAAKHYQQSLLKLGTPARITKVKEGHADFYRVQLGPYFQLNQARMAQKKLQKKGFEVLVRKIIQT